MKRLRLSRKPPRIKRISYDESGRHVEYVRYKNKQEKGKEELSGIVSTQSNMDTNSHIETTEEKSTQIPSKFYEK